MFEFSDISAIYRISEPNDTIFAIENRSVEKSKKIGEISPIYRPVIDISVDFSALGDTRAWGIFLAISRRYIADISKISVKYRRYIGNIGNNIEDISVIYRDISGIYQNDQI